ncbi:hypothetical protein [Lichenifustis flavocetrariae]|uniref:Uncharacterized protein n=1 Tax=Lichenifustis flavocetrariae TaxID=2949735 RepID=A0AA41Z439_9HYPH|nr:hypothetical protein [Lichenifustis flavocetrariae]MCW6512435.1 hypothetical protein [Lichenifustis flavocetrariae]
MTSFPKGGIVDSRRRVHVRQARSDDAEAAWAVLRRSILDLCQADHGHDAATLEHWLANKTPETVFPPSCDTGRLALTPILDEPATAVTSDSAPV